MEVGIFMELVGTMGFPIVMVGACGFLILKMYQVQMKDKDKIYTELALSREANTKFAEIIASFAGKLDNLQDDVKEIKTKLK